MKKSSFFVFFLTAFLISCGSNHRVFLIGREIVSKKPEVEKTITPSVVISGPNMIGGYGLHTVSDSILVLNIKDENHLYRAINLRNDQCLDFLGKGRGPGEVITGGFSRVRTTKDSIFLDIYGINEHVLYTLDFNETLKGGSDVIRDKVELLPEAMTSFKIGEEILSEVVYDDDIFSLKLYDSKDHNVFRVINPYGRDEFLAYCDPILQSLKGVKPDETRLSMVMMFFNEVNIIDITGDQHISVSVSKHTKDLGIIQRFLKDRTSSHVYYWGATVSEEAIFALFYDCGLESIEDIQPEIHVFSWDGKLMAVYHLKESLRDITISNDGRTLFGLSWDEIIYQYDL